MFKENSGVRGQGRSGVRGQEGIGEGGRRAQRRAAPTPALARGRGRTSWRAGDVSPPVRGPSRGIDGERDVDRCKGANRRAAKAIVRAETFVPTGRLTPAARPGA